MRAQSSRPWRSGTLYHPGRCADGRQSGLQGPMRPHCRIADCQPPLPPCLAADQLAISRIVRPIAHRPLPKLADPLPWQTYGSGVTVTVTPRRWSSSANRRLLRSGYFPVRQVPSASSSAAPVTSATGVPPQAARRSGHARAGRPCAGLGFSGRWCQLGVPSLHFRDGHDHDVRRATHSTDCARVCRLWCRFACTDGYMVAT